MGLFGLLLSNMSNLYVLEKNHLLNFRFANMFSICVACIFILISKNIMILVESNLIDFFLDQAFCVVSKNTLSSLRLFLFSFLPEYCSYNLCLYMMFFLGLLFVHGKKKKAVNIHHFISFSRTMLEKRDCLGIMF